MVQYRSIVVIGDINADQTLFLPTYPEEGDSVTAQALHWSSGGAGLNAATAFALLGAPVLLLGRVGSDPAASMALRAAHEAGVDLRAIQKDEALATGICTTVVSADGQRTFFSFRGANVAFDPAAITPELANLAGLFYLSAYALLEGAQQAAALRATELAREQQIPLVLDLANPPLRHCRTLIYDLLPQVSLLCLNEQELHLLLPDQPIATALETLLKLGVRQVALKRGAQGCTVASADRYCELPALAVPVVDTTGCGDAFAAGFAWALYQDATLLECATLANLLGGLTATRPGAATALPSRGELRTWLDPALLRLLETSSKEEPR